MFYIRKLGQYIQLINTPTYKSIPCNWQHDDTVVQISTANQTLLHINQIKHQEPNSSGLSVGPEQSLQFFRTAKCSTCALNH